MFKFTFNIGSHLFNPFTAHRQATETGTERERGSVGFRISTAATVIEADALQSLPPNGMRRLPAPPRRLADAETDAAPLTPIPISSSSRKRGWVPSSSSPSTPLSTTAFTNGWFDTPSRYVEAADASTGSTVGESYDGRSNCEDDPDSQRPTKRRKTLADSILSTALSAALIGTAVGMSAYRMWRDRGSSSKQLRASSTTDENIVDHPPPPYEQKDWVQTTASQSKVESVPVQSTPQHPPHQISTLPSVPRTPRSARTSKARKVARAAKYHATYSPKRRLSPSKTHFNDPDANNTQDELDVQLDSMDDKIRRLIEEGQKALGKEVVIMNDDDRYNEEGAVDDGLDGWEDEHKTSRIPGDHRRKKKSPSNTNAQGGFFIVPSTSLPSRLNEHPVPLSSSSSRGNRSASPTKKNRPRALTGTSRLGSPVETPPSVQVIYEPVNNIVKNSASASGMQFDFEDKDSFDLSQHMEKIRQAYRLR